MPWPIRNTSYIVHETCVKNTQWGGLFKFIVKMIVSLPMHWYFDIVLTCIDKSNILSYHILIYIKFGMPIGSIEICCTKIDKNFRTKKCASLRYFDTCFMHNIGRVFDRRWHDFLSVYYIDKESCLSLD